MSRRASDTRSMRASRRAASSRAAWARWRRLAEMSDMALNLERRPNQPSGAHGEEHVMATRRRIIVRLATSADGYIARPDGNLDWLTSRPKPAGFYGITAFMKSVDTKLLGRKTYEEGLRL